jgi:low temperature requirement protein LtrA
MVGHNGRGGAPTTRPSAPVRVSTLELFFDLVFVFTITQITSVVDEAPDTHGVARAAVELSVIFWMYGGFAWLTNTSEPNSPLRRLVLLFGMGAFFVVSLAVPAAFGDSGVTFGIAYLAVMVVHASGFLVFAGRSALVAVSRLLPWNLLSGGLVLAAGFADGIAVPVLWLAAVLVQLATPLVIGLGQNFAISSAHFGERHGLVILIVLGESLVGVALANQGEVVAPHSVVGALAGLLVVAAMWWLYFGGDDDRAVAAMEHAPPRARPRRAVTGYFLAHYVMILGVLLLAAGLRLETGDLLVAASTSGAWLVALGVAAYTLGSGGFRLALHFADPTSRVAAAVACLATAPLGMAAGTAVQLGALAVVVMASALVRGR